MITVAILEDIKSDSEEISRITNSFFQNQYIDCRILEYSDPNTLLSECNSKDVSIYLIDIELKKLTSNGIDVAKQINVTSPNAQIIFITAFDRYYLDVYKADHIFFIPKTKLKSLLPDALEKAMRHIDESTSHLIRFSYNRTTYMLQENKIRYMEKMLRKIRIVANEEYECYGKFEDILSQSSTGNLIQCHKSYVVNTHYIEQLNSSSCKLLDGTEIPVAKKQYHAILNQMISREHAE